MSSSDQPSPDRPQLTQLYHSPQYVPSRPLNSKSSQPSPQTKPSFSLSTPLKPSYSSAPLSPIPPCSHVEPGNYCFDCLDSPKKNLTNSPQMDLNYSVPSPSTALSTEFTAMRIMSPSAAMSQTQISSTKSPRPILQYSPESSAHSHEAHPHEQASTILRRHHSSNSSEWSGPPELPLPPLIPLPPAPSSRQPPPAPSSRQPPPAPSSRQPHAYGKVPPNKSQTRYKEYENNDYYEDNGDLPSCPDNFGINLDDRQLVCISTRSLNKCLKSKTLRKDDAQKLKQKRRTLKNRGYAANCRANRDEEANTLANEVEDLEQRANSIDAEFVKKQKLLREVRYNFKRVFEWADNNPDIDVNKYFATYKKII